MSKTVMNYYLIDQLKNSGEYDELIIDLLKYELDKLIYYYGDHFKYQKGTSNNHFKKIIKKYYRLVKLYKNKTTGKNQGKVIVSNAYFNLDQVLEVKGHQVICQPWQIKATYNIFANKAIYEETLCLMEAFVRNNFIELISEAFLNRIREYLSHLKEYCRFVALFDGSEHKLPVAKNEKELLVLLRQKRLIKPSVFYDYVKMPFNLDYLEALT